MNIRSTGVMTSRTAKFLYFNAPVMAPAVSASSTFSMTWIWSNFMSSDVEYVVAISCPRALSSIHDNGNATGNSKIRTMRTSGTEALPMAKEYRLQSACGMISPKMTIKIVDKRKPTSPPALSARRMDNRELAPTFPRTSEQSNKLPRFRKG